MSLRFRISLIVFGFVAVIVAGLIATGQVREQLLREEQAARVAAQNSGLWDKIVENGIRRMREHAPQVLGDTVLRAALASGDRGVISNAASRLYANLVAAGTTDRLDLVAADGVVIYSSVSSFVPSAPVRTALLERMIADGWSGAGIGNDAARNVTLSIGLPIMGVDGTALGVVILSTEILDALRELQGDETADVLVVNRRGRLLVGTNPVLWELLRGSVQLAGADVQNLRIGDRFYGISFVPLEAELGNLVARLLVVRDVTAATLKRNQIGWLSLGLVGAFLLLALAGLSLYLHRAFSPLTAGVEVLDALSRGDTAAAATVEAGEGSDELARIAHAVNAFREQTISVQRQQRSRERWRRQQERFIRDEMTRLADTLKGEVRAEIIAELAEIESEMQSLQDTRSTPGRAMGLQMIGLAFERLTDRIAAQQNRLTSLVAHLQQTVKAERELRALQDDLKLAARVQTSFLPGDRHESGAMVVRATMIPARDVGGDFYDYFPLDEHRTALVIADVAGKGIPAALVMAVARTVIRAVAEQFRDSPGRCLETVNDLLVNSMREEDVFVTVFYGIYDERDGSLVYANGGHNPPARVDDQQVSLLESTKGVVLGMFDGLRYQEQSLTVPPGGRVFFYTDGVTEAENPDEQEFGELRMIDVLVQTRRERPITVLERMQQAIVQHAGDADQSDDITMLLLTRHPGGGGGTPA